MFVFGFTKTAVFLECCVHRWQPSTSVAAMRLHCDFVDLLRASHCTHSISKSTGQLFFKLFNKFSIDFLVEAL